MMNIGGNPTVSDASVQTVEVHLFDFEQDIYGECVTVCVVERLRATQKFASLRELQEALMVDRQIAKNVLREQNRGGIQK
jgi:riboflavin kinase/FMN adenylyltransferase